MPAGFEVSGRTEECKIAAYANEKKRIYGLQFHPEVQHTTSGMRILGNFVRICGCKQNYTIKGLDRKLIAEIKATVGSGAVIMGVSGGVDSLVASALIKKATPNIHCVFVDHGIIRKGEAEYVRRLYEKLGFKHYYYADALKRGDNLTRAAEVLKLGLHYYPTNEDLKRLLDEVTKISANR